MVEPVEEPVFQDFCLSDRYENEEEELNQDNPIYGNIHVDGAGPLRMVADVCYERMTKQCMRQDEKAELTDISYASLDLSVNQKQKKKRKYPQKQNLTHQAQTHSQPIAQQSSLEMGTDTEATLPSRTASLMASRHSIYLNSHQVALETEDRERQRERMRERKHNRVRGMEAMNLPYDFELGFGQSDPSHEQDS
ncbi:uncharacterized protein LOC113581685 isoform X2 [Electrophorus electricus]|uniref:uncharacterized protein LOC113581685 isoform X2 n=1 Tax=Electrophorus electricus TaxID=8005 RepID=UPI000F0A66B5|nr:uncharacterized protein LOC113581685 isoform X2 [Electrophorus electricus]